VEMRGTSWWRMLVRSHDVQVAYDLRYVGFVLLSTNGSNDFRREGSYVSALTLRAQGEAHTWPKHNILDSEITIGSFLWLNGLRRSKIKPIVEPEVFPKQMYGIEESSCGIVGTFRRPGNCSSLAPLVTSLQLCFGRSKAFRAWIIDV